MLLTSSVLTVMALMFAVDATPHAHLPKLGDAPTAANPTLNLNQPTTFVVEGGKNYYNEPGFNATDQGLDVTSRVTYALTNTSYTLTTFAFYLGNYTIVYNYTNSATNASVSQNRTVIVQDTIAPSITLLGSTNFTLYKGDAWVEGGFYAFDSFQGNITASVTTKTVFDADDGTTSTNITGANSFIDTSTPGSYVVFYQVADAAGNQAKPRSRTVVVSPVTNTCNAGDNGAVTTAFLGVIIFVVAAMLISTLVRQHGLVIFADPQSDPGFIHQSLGFEDEETTRVLDIKE
jgi:hypothetical protein